MEGERTYVQTSVSPQALQARIRPVNLTLTVAARHLVEFAGMRRVRDLQSTE